MSHILKHFKVGQAVTLQHKTNSSLTVSGLVHAKFDDELGRLEVLDPTDNSLHMIYIEDKFWEIVAQKA